MEKETARCREEREDTESQGVGGKPGDWMHCAGFRYT